MRKCIRDSVENTEARKTRWGRRARREGNIKMDFKGKGEIGVDL
jgi:hypothetical protein